MQKLTTRHQSVRHVRHSSLSHIEAVSVSNSLIYRPKPLVQSTSNSKANQSISYQTCSVSRILSGCLQERSSPISQRRSLSPKPVPQKNIQRKDLKVETKQNARSTKHLQDTLNKFYNKSPVQAPKASLSSSYKQVSQSVCLNNIDIKNEIVSETMKSLDNILSNIQISRASQKTTDQSLESQLNTSSSKSSISKQNLSTSSFSNKKKPISNTKSIMKNVYSVKNKPKSIIDMITNLSKERIEHTSAQFSKVTDDLISKVLKDVKDSSSKFAQKSVASLEHKKKNYEIKRTSSPFLQNNVTIPNSVVFEEDDEETEEENPSQKDIEVSRSDIKMNSREKLETLHEYENETEEDRENNIKCKDTKKQEDGAQYVEENLENSALKDLLEVFVECLDSVWEPLVIKQKRTAFIRMLEHLQRHKVILTKALTLYESRLKSKYFYLLFRFVQARKQSSRSETLHYHQVAQGNNLKHVTDTHNHKVSQTHVRYNSIDSGNYKPVRQRKHSTSAKVKQNQKSISFMPKELIPNSTHRGSAPDIETKPKSPEIYARRGNENCKNKSNKTFSQQPSPLNRTLKGTNPNNTPNQSFLRPFDKNWSEISHEYMKDSPKKSYELAQDTLLNQSFGCENLAQSSKKCQGIFDSLLSDVWTPSQGIYDLEDSFSEQVLTVIPQPSERERVDTSEFGGRYPSSPQKKTLSYEEKNKNKSNALKENNKSFGGCHSSLLHNSNLKQMTQNSLTKKSQKELEKKIFERREVTKVIKKKPEGVYKSIATKENESKCLKPQSYEKYLIKKQKTIVQTSEQQEREETEQSEDEEIIGLNYAKALSFHRNKLLEVYAHRFLKTLEVITNRKIETVNYFRTQNLIRRGFKGFYELVKNNKLKKNANSSENSEIWNKLTNDTEASEVIETKMEIAKDYYESTVKMNIFNILIQNMVQNSQRNREAEKSKVPSEYDDYREIYLKRACFVKWFEVKSISKEKPNIMKS